uniref:Uncharacterized protein n=1 Tax=Setaria viridis TaxID=4556 RepID=A0A4U6SWX0_SETVI|nr:hypothetical protein SEVIR_9G224800v2 [Setaria viridis]
MSRRAARNLTLLIIREERNARVFRRHETSTTNLMSKIKEEATAWMMAGAKDLAEFPGGDNKTRDMRAHVMLAV